MKVAPLVSPVRVSGAGPSCSSARLYRRACHSSGRSAGPPITWFSPAEAGHHGRGRGLSPAAISSPWSRMKSSFVKAQAGRCPDNRPQAATRLHRRTDAPRRRRSARQSARSPSWPAATRIAQPRPLTAHVSRRASGSEIPCGRPGPGLAGASSTSPFAVNCTCRRAPAAGTRSGSLERHRLLAASRRSGPREIARRVPVAALPSIRFAPGRRCARPTSTTRRRRLHWRRCGSNGSP